MNFNAWKNMKPVCSARLYTREQAMEIITPIICAEDYLIPQMKKEKRIDWL